MHARDVMVAPVITVKPSTTVKEVAELFLEKRISAAPVIDSQEKLVGIVSEGDLLHRVEAGTERHRSWWLEGFIGNDTLATEYVKAHGRKVSDVMTRKVITASPQTPLHEVATLMEKNAIKRVPILENGQLVGIVSRANLIQAVATARKLLDIPLSDTTIREKILSHLKKQPWAHTTMLNVTVNAGVVDLWGIADSAAERKAIKVAAESVPGVCAVNDNLITRTVGGWG
jgi:CBS domain-containing protein